MKTAILSCFPPYRGGISQFNTSLYGELSKQHEVRAFNFKRQYPEFLFPGKTQYIAEDDPNRDFPDTTRLLDTANPFTYRRTAKAIADWGADLLLMRYWMPYFAPSLGYVARHVGKNCKVISILDNVIPHEKHFFDIPLTRWFLNGNDAFVVLCHAVGKDLERLKPQARYLVSQHPVYSNFGEKLERNASASALGLDPTKKTLLFFGLIREYKGLDLLIEAFAHLDDSYQLLIAGEAYGSFDKYDALIRNNPNQARIHVFNRFIKDEEVNRYFCASDLCVLPYRSATQSGISAIAYHFDLPMVTTAVGGLKEMIGDTGTGLLTESISPEAVQKAITAYFADPEQKSRLVANIQAEKKRLSWETFAANLTEFYHTL
ncbi:MAG: glycosyltransferase [Bacteroidales bacterium]|nr:glycosyltransferase [Bacteroidales bacterium]